MSKPTADIMQPVVESLYERTARTGIDENYRVVRGIAAVGGLVVTLICLGSLWAGHSVNWTTICVLLFFLLSFSLPLSILLHQRASRGYFIAESLTSGLLGFMFIVFTVFGINAKYEGDGNEAFLFIIPMTAVFLAKSFMAALRAAAFIEIETQ